MVSFRTVPTVIESTARGERAFDIYSRLLRERIVFLGSEIDDDVANLVIAELLFLDSVEEEKDIALYVNSPGGASTAMFAIYDAMTSLSSDVATYCVGQAASAAAFLLASGSPGKRHALANSRVLLHQPHGGMQGQSSDIAIHAREMVRQRERMEVLLAEHCGKDVGTIHADLDRDFILDADEAKAYGVVDVVVQRRRLAPVSRLPELSPPG